MQKIKQGTDNEGKWKKARMSKKTDVYHDKHNCI